ncbi:ankyrin [Choiromyces venosus 120613-1]|uniref:Ankyrin n=1 Tax=Choiromyces venosus 120613-1 TaxID=1336337 RepID=A0A3N4JF49_9PEZI|nr:ankyrin [Choiromyces venosus 120613-1]
MKAQNGTQSRLGMEVLMWVSHSERPLRTNELCHTLGVERGSTDMNPQSRASMEGRIGVVKALLEWSDIDPNSLDNDGRTPLCCASGKGHVDVVKALLEQGDIDLKMVDNDGRTLLRWSCSKGHVDVVKVLL